MYFAVLTLRPKEIEYATGVASGKKYNTQIKVGNGSLVVQNQVIGVANAYDEQ